uniref:Uncharacterized protein n=1 Tax=Timema genevievae TaxID=629358 RepID=A0A7R9K8C2_TIMGE|nr:unnamed protein product [Timema genevievae]
MLHRLICGHPMARFTFCLGLLSGGRKRYDGMIKAPSEQTTTPLLTTSPTRLLLWQINSTNENIIAKRKWLSPNSIMSTQCFARKFLGSAFFLVTPFQNLYEYYNPSVLVSENPTV